MASWCILRTAAPRTLLLAKALEDDGFIVWTPTAKVVTRAGKSRKPKPKAVALLPTFLFADYEALPLLLRASIDPGMPYPSFSIFKHDDSFPRVPDAALEGLRRHEDKAQRAADKEAPVQCFVKGQRVRTSGTAFDGMDGTVVKVSSGKGRIVFVDFPGFAMPVEIGAWLLKENRLYEPESKRDADRKARRAS